MNRKRARKIAQAKLPTVQELDAMRKYVARVRGAELLLQAAVAQAGGRMVLAQSAVESAPRISVERTPSGGFVLASVSAATQSVDEKIAAARAQAEAAIPAAAGASEVPA